MEEENVVQEDTVLESEVEEAVKTQPKKKVTTKKDLPTDKELESASESDILSTLDSKTKELYLEFSSFLKTKASITPDEGVKQTLSTGIDLLDAVMGGGFAIGTLGVVTGAPGSGKSMLAIQTLAAAQKKFQGNILTAFLDSEEATTTERMANLGVLYPKLKPYTDLTLEKVFKFLESLCLFKESKNLIEVPSVVVWDSVANTLTEKEREVEDINSVIGYKAKVLSILIPKYVAKASLYNICLIVVNQLRDVLQIGPFAPAKELKFMSTGKDMPGGTTLKFNAFHLLEMNIKSALPKEKFGFDGILVKAKCVKNKLFPPNIEVELVGNFVTGFSNFWTNYNFLINTKRIETPGGWCHLVSMPQKKFRAKEVLSLYNSDQEFKQEFDKVTAEAIKAEILDKSPAS